MKKGILFLLLSLFVVFSLRGQSIDFKKDGEYYYLVSPNGRFYAGAKDASFAHFFDLETKTSFDVAPEERGYKVNSINNLGQVAGANEMKAAIWEHGEEWTILPLPDDATEDEKAWSEATGISDDGKFLVGTLGEFPTRIVFWTKQDDGSYGVECLTTPKTDPIYRDGPQFFQARNMSSDGSRFLVRWRISDGHVEFPLVYTKADDGTWSYKFVDADFVVYPGSQIPEYPNVEGLPFDEADRLIEEYIVAINEAETGYYPRLDGSAMSANGRYVACKMGYQAKDADYGVFFGAVYDIEKDTTIVFTKISNASCMSVDNNGNASLCTPATEEFRWAYIVNIEMPDSVQTLTEWTKQRSSDKIDLSVYMQYPINERYELTLAEGTTYLASEGNGFMTYQTNVIGTGLVESFFVRFDVAADDEAVLDDLELFVYPNPTSGLLFFDDCFTDLIVYNVSSGQVVYKQLFVDSSVDLSSLLSGVYSVVASKGGKVFRTNIIIK